MPDTGKKESIFLLSTIVIFFFFDIIYLLFIKYDKIYLNNTMKIINVLRIILIIISFIFPIYIIYTRSVKSVFTDNNSWYREKFFVYFGLYYSILILFFQIIVNLYNLGVILKKDKNANYFISIGLGFLQISISVTIIGSWTRMKKYSIARVEQYNELPENRKNLDKKHTSSQLNAINENNDNINNMNNNIDHNYSNDNNINNIEYTNINVKRNSKDGIKGENFENKEDKEELEEFVVIKMKKIIKTDYSKNSKKENNCYLTLKKYRDTNDFILCEHNAGKNLNFFNIKLMKCQLKHEGE